MLVHKCLVEVLEQITNQGWEVVGLRCALPGEYRVCVTGAITAVVKVLERGDTALNTTVLVVRKKKQPVWTIRVLENTPRLLKPGERGIFHLEDFSPSIYTHTTAGSYNVYPISITRGEE